MKPPDTNTAAALSPFISVNWHITEVCNYRCRFCFATFATMPQASAITLEDGHRLLRRLARLGCRKITFAGGEPMMHPHLFTWLQEAKRLKLTTMLITNGSFLTTKKCGKLAGYLNWLGLSIDASTRELQKALGRGDYDPLNRAANLSKLARSCGLRFKLNTVVTRLNKDDDMSDLVTVAQPERWKIFQYLPIEGERIDPELIITKKDFNRYAQRHAALRERGIDIAVEDNDTMTGSYVMIDPCGQLFDNRMSGNGASGSRHGQRKYSINLLQSDPDEALDEMHFSLDRLKQRGGLYAW